MCRAFVCPFSLLTVFFFFFNDTATTEIYTLSLHDALPICVRRIALPRQGTKTCDDFAGAPAVADHPLDRPTHFFKVGFISQQPSQAGFAICHNRRERLVDLVSNRRGELAQGTNARDVLELATCVMKGVLRVLLLRNVAVGLHGGDWAPAFVALYHPTAYDPYFTAVASRVNEFSLPTAGVVQLVCGAGRRRILCLQ